MDKQNQAENGGQVVDVAGVPETPSMKPVATQPSAKKLPIHLLD